MPWRYTHANVTQEDTHTFACDLRCRQCEAPARDGSRCKRTVCIWMPFCWQHAQRLLGVRVAPSRVLANSNGLFATRAFAKGEMVAPYGGDVLTEADVKSRYGSGPYAIGPYLLSRVDSACNRYIASAANGGFGTVDRALVNIVYFPTAHQYHGPPKREGTVYQGRRLSRDNLGIKWWTFASRDIAAGDEIVASYSDDSSGGGYDGALLRRLEECSARNVDCDKTARRSRR